MKSNRASLMLHALCRQVSDKPGNPVKIVAYCSKGEIAPSAQQTANDAALVAVIYNKQRAWFCADAAKPSLSVSHAVVLIDADAVSLPKVVRPYLGTSPSFVGVIAQSLGLFFRSARVALISAPVPVSGSDPEKLKWQSRIAGTACFNRGSHDANHLSLIGQRLARADNTCGPRHFTVLEA